VVAGVLAGARPARDLAGEAVAMRAEMARHKPPTGPLDAKLLPGGLVDLEFTVHLTQLRHRTGLDPHLGTAIGALVGEGLLPAGLAAANDLLTRLLVVLRLVAPDAAAPPPATRDLIARALRVEGWEAVLAALDATRQEVEAAWAGTTGDGHG
jgi:glutamate-ammonia-ligase adenylyltransferase